MIIVNYRFFIAVKQESILFFPTSVFLMPFPPHPQYK